MDLRRLLALPGEPQKKFRISRDYEVALNLGALQMHHDELVALCRGVSIGDLADWKVLLDVAKPRDPFYAKLLAALGGSLGVWETFPSQDAPGELWFPWSPSIALPVAGRRVPKPSAGDLVEEESEED